MEDIWNPWEALGSLRKTLENLGGALGSLLGNLVGILGEKFGSREVETFGKL